MRKEVQTLTREVSVHGLFDFGYDAFSTLEFELDGEFNENTEVVIGEVLRDGHIAHLPGFKTFYQHVFRMENGHHVYRFPIPTHIPAYEGFPHCLAPQEAGGEVAPFRYVEVNRYYGKATVRRTAWFGDGDDQAASFTSSDPVLNKVWDFCKYTMKATSVFDRYVDGERERMPYEGDAYINQLGHFCCDLNFTLAKATLDHFFVAGKYTWPTEWLLLTPILVRDYWLYSGDADSVRRWLPLLEEKLLGKYVNSEGLLAPAEFAGERNQQVWDDQHRLVHNEVRDIVDWPETERDGYEQSKVNFVPNAYLYAALLAMAELSGCESYAQRAAALRSAIRKTFLKNGLFVDSVGSNHTGIHSAMFALDAGLAEGAEIEAHKGVIASRGMACSVYGAQFLLDACYKYGLADHALKLMTDAGERGWVNMMREGATIAMESWGDKWKANQDWNHPWGAAPANVVTRRLCGIRPAAPGFAKFIVEPQPGALTDFTCVQPTIHGAVKLVYRKGAGYELTVPAGTEALSGGKTFAAGTHHVAE